uniref:Uncharacterized protein n=1 Tax=Zea mays TaxID=4577 RepID=C4J5C4_MAIZE|nr:unknown [Zea mays]
MTKSRLKVKTASATTPCSAPTPSASACTGVASPPVSHLSRKQAAEEPSIWAAMYREERNSVTCPPTASDSVTAGLTWPPEMWKPRRRDHRHHQRLPQRHRRQIASSGATLRRRSCITCMYTYGLDQHDASTNYT